MATLTVPYSFIDATPIVASEMNTNFGAVKTFVEALADGSNIDTGAITSDKLATSAIQLLTPTGSIVSYAGANAPTGWAICNGQELSKTTYAALYAVIGDTYNTAGGQSAPSAGNFRVPILNGRVPVGKAASGTFASLAATGGTETNTLAEANLPSHKHGLGTLDMNNQLGDHQHGVGTYDMNNQLGDHQHGSGTLQTLSGGSHSHGVGYNNYLVVNNADTVAPILDANATMGVIQTDTSGSHGHSMQGSTANTNLQHKHGLSGSSGIINLQHKHTLSGETGLIGSGTAFNILSPFIVVNFIIKL